jgi:hypothetical protein
MRLETDGTEPGFGGKTPSGGVTFVNLVKR